MQTNSLFHHEGLPIRLIDLLSSGEGFNDWGSELDNLSRLCRELMVLLGKPGVIDKLNIHHQETASENLCRMADYFHLLRDDGELPAVLDMIEAA